ncbi:MAG: DUF167 domain-containing protein [Desulfurococcales archaeon]|nr:DUF167 domain-containing protein [Desulfurococcales archaeon]
MPVNVEVIRKLIEPYKEGAKFQVYVKPESNRVALVLEEDELVFYTDEPPVGGRANASLIRFVSRALGVSPHKVDIVYGHRSRVKTVYVEGVDPDTLAERLAEVAEPW